MTVRYALIATSLLLCGLIYVNKGRIHDSNDQAEVYVPPELIPSEEGAITSIGRHTEVIDPDYSPGDVEWKLPTKEEQDSWDHDFHVSAVEKWAEPRLARWTCNTCKEKLNKDFKFIERRISDDIVFESKCKCGHTHKLVLKGKQEE